MKGDRVGEFEELTLLAVRALEDGAYAVSVQEFVEAEARRDVSMGAVYGALERLERKGFLRSAFGEATAERGGKRKRFFSVTPLGLQTLRDLRRVRDGIWQTLERTSRS